MKQIKIVIYALLGLFTMVACNDSSKKITEKDICALIKSDIEDVQADDTTTINVGYYELSSEADRTKLRKLAAAGVITYASETILDSKEEKHIFVKVALTPEGEKWIYVPKSKQPCCKDADMKNSYLNESYPDETALSAEDIVTINPASCVDTVLPPKKAEDVKTKSVAEMQTKELSVFELAQLHSFKKEVVVYCQQRTLFKVRNIKDSVEKKCGNDTAKKVKISVTLPNESKPYVIDIDPGKQTGSTSDCKCDTSKKEPRHLASAEVIIENSVVTPFGRVYKNLVKGDKTLYVYHFVYGKEKYTEKKCWMIDSTMKKEEKSNNHTCAVDELLNMYENAYKEYRDLSKAATPNEAALKAAKEKIASIEKKLQYVESRFTDKQKDRKEAIEKDKEYSASSCNSSCQKNACSVAADQPQPQQQENPVPETTPDVPAEGEDVPAPDFGEASFDAYAIEE